MGTDTKKACTTNFWFNSFAWSWSNWTKL